jgi:hypothetical protein
MTSKQIQSLVYATAFGDGMPDTLANLIVWQSQHETDDYTSNAFKKNSNLFGYKTFAGSKWQTGAGITSSEGDPYASYATIEDSVHELTSWIKRRQFKGQFPTDLNKIKTPQDYALLLKACGYFGDTVGHYVSGLIHFKNSDV